jgi:hypothetical protein
MPNELTLYTSDKHWRVDVEAWANDLRFFKSVGIHVAVYHLERMTSIWGSPRVDWEEEPATLIRIHNVYSGLGPAIATREREWLHASRVELKAWSAGRPIRLVADSITADTGTVVLDIYKVEGTVTVVIGHEILTGVVSASSAVTERAMPVAA